MPRLREQLPTAPTPNRTTAQPVAWKVPGVPEVAEALTDHAQQPNHPTAQPLAWKVSMPEMKEASLLRL
jgi:hypothetical protein